MWFKIPENCEKNLNGYVSILKNLKNLFSAAWKNDYCFTYSTINIDITFKDPCLFFSLPSFLDSFFSFFFFFVPKIVLLQNFAIFLLFLGYLSTMNNIYTHNISETDISMHTTYT